MTQEAPEKMNRPCVEVLIVPERMNPSVSGKRVLDGWCGVNSLFSGKKTVR
jgi:hypothetical protein